jgi:hypothetical protein
MTDVTARLLAQDLTGETHVATERNRVMYAREMLDLGARSLKVDATVLAAAIDALNDCVQACIADTDCDLSERDLPEMVKCIRLCLDCVDVCTAAVRVISRPSSIEITTVEPLLRACVATCQTCGDECERHAQAHEHCRICAEACRACQQACEELHRLLQP